MGAGAGKTVVREVDGRDGEGARGTGLTSVVTVQPVTVQPKKAGETASSWSDVASDAQEEPPPASSADFGGANAGAGAGAWASKPLGGAAPAAAAGGGAGSGAFGTSSSSSSRGGFEVGQAVRITGLGRAPHLNGQEGAVVEFDNSTARWRVRLGNGEEKSVRSENLEAVGSDAARPTGSARAAPAATAGGTGGTAARSGSTGFLGDLGNGGGGYSSDGGAGMDPDSDANKELESLLLQSNWSAIYQLFHQRFGVAALDRIDRSYVVKSAVEMTLSIVAKCFALLRSDPHGRLHCTPLHIAALQSSEEAAEVIVRDIPQMVAQTHTPSHTALCPLHIAILCGSQTIVELLLEGKANPNVRTIHDICPLHLAATTSKDMCQVLLSYGAEPQKRDVMGSTSLHFASAFKQHAAVELLLGAAQNAGRLVCDADQKRVTPLHIACSLYTGDEDLLAPMALIAAGAKPRQADCHGASARDLVPWSRSSALQQFFEANGDQAQSAAQKWLDEQYLNESSDGDDEGDEDPPAGDAVPSTLVGGHRARKQAAAAAAAAAGGSNKAAELSAEVDERNAQLAQYEEQCAALRRELSEAEHLRAKCAMLEQAAANQQKVFDGLQALYDSERSQHEKQLEALQQRYAAERAEAEARASLQIEQARADVQQTQSRHSGAQQLELSVKLQEMQVELENARARAAAAEAELAAAEAKLGQTRLSATFASPDGAGAGCGGGGGGAASAELSERIVDLEGEVQRLVELEEKARTVSDGQRAQLQEFRSAIFALGVKHSLGMSGEAAQELLAPLEAELDRRKAEGSSKEGEVKAAQDQVKVLQEEAAGLRRAKVEAEDKATKLSFECQELQNKSSASVLQLETKLKELELEKGKAVALAQSDADAFQRRMEAAEAVSKEAQSTIEKLRARIHNLEDAFAEEQKVRKKYHNQIQDMKGAIRVFCRFRPMVAREAGDTVVLSKTDAFTAQLQRPAPHNDVKPFPFDAIFDGDSTQEDVFADCRELVQSAVDGYNVTIFAYGQTGAGKTHTMYGNREQPGLAPRSIQSLFEVIRREEKGGKKSFKVKTYMIEVYKQDIIDLLSDKPPAKDKKGGLDVKKDVGRGMMYVDGVTEKTITSPEELMSTLTEGEKKRHVSATKMNSASSRSHLLLSIIIECSDKDADQVLYGKITLCDLAGSERPKKSEVTGDALKEAIEINKSLSALGDVVEALTKGSKSVPYRNHKLTMLMQDSLGGSAKTLMFVNCSPAGGNFEETQMSLKWASRARQVTNDVKRNADSREVARLKQVIAMMGRAQNAEASPDDVQADHNDGANMDMKMAMNATARDR